MRNWGRGTVRISEEVIYMKKQFEEPEVEFVSFETEEVMVEYYGNTSFIPV